MDHEDEIIWIPGKLILTGPGTETDRPLTPALVNTMSAGHVAIDLSDIESRRHDRLLG